MTCYNANDPRFRAENDSATIQNAINATREGDCRAVDTHIRRLREKLGSAAECIKTVIKSGYRLEV